MARPLSNCTRPKTPWFCMVSWRGSHDWEFEMLSQLVCDSWRRHTLEVIWVLFVTDSAIWRDFPDIDYGYLSLTARVVAPELHSYRQSGKLSFYVKPCMAVIAAQNFLTMLSSAQTWHMLMGTSKLVSTHSSFSPCKVIAILLRSCSQGYSWFRPCWTDDPASPCFCLDFSYSFLSTLSDPCFVVGGTRITDLGNYSLWFQYPYSNFSHRELTPRGWGHRGCRTCGCRILIF